jgi:hypothetical protein
MEMEFGDGFGGYQKGSYFPTWALGYVFTEKMYWGHNPTPGSYFFTWVAKHFPRSVYARSMKDGGVPKTFAGKNCLPWPTKAQFAELEAHGIHGHCHRLRPGDVYIIRSGTVHFVLNVDGVTFSVACDMVPERFCPAKF